jgi:hypothetical protein
MNMYVEAEAKLHVFLSSALGGAEFYAPALRKQLLVSVTRIRG